MLDDVPVPLFGRPVSGWYSWFAWKPVRTWDGRWVFFRKIQRRLIQKPPYLTGPALQWFQYKI